MTMREFAFDHRASMAAGRVVVDVRNGGALTHELSIVPLPPDFPPIAEQLRSSVRRPLPAMANVSRQPGAERRFALDLQPGRYALLCFLVADDGETHARKGMASEVVVR
ncbi:MAG TPA: hypothetical protein VHM89_03890 [Acidimicrobiales bacterium]|nr:hypothetical protein [Acidimicrobiales bacterium]